MRSEIYSQPLGMRASRPCRDFTIIAAQAFLREKNALNAATASGTHPFAEQMALLIDPAGQIFWRKSQELSRDRDRFRRQRANLTRNLARLGFGVTGRHHDAAEARDAGILGTARASHHQHGNRTM